MFTLKILPCGSSLVVGPCTIKRVQALVKEGKRGGPPREGKEEGPLKE